MSLSLPKLSLALLAVLLIVVPATFAAEVSREEYVQRADLICKKSEKANSRILNGVTGLVRRGKLAPAAKRVLRASNQFGRSVAAISRLPRPDADQAKLQSWIRQLRGEQKLLRSVGVALKRNQKAKANRLAVRLQTATRRAKNTVFTFEFTYCDREVTVS